jgi:hypothetical protein
MTDPMVNNPALLTEAVRGMSQTMAVLTASIDEQNEKLDTQNDQLEALAEAQRSQRWINALLAGLYTLDIALILGSIITFVFVIGGLREQDQILAETRSEVLCPLFRIMTALDSPAARAMYQHGPEAYDRDMSEIRNGYIILKCR